MWYQCYHSSKYPTITFDYIDNPQTVSSRMSNYDEVLNTNTFSNESKEPHQSHMRISSPINVTQTLPRSLHTSFEDHISNNVGDISHIPRTPPSPATYTVPSVINKSIRADDKELFGMIKLGESDICYTSGTIEWVGRKRSFPINSGFKIVARKEINEPDLKKRKGGLKNNLDCECADVLPTVNAIVDHLNALHEAVDLVDLRLNTIEEVMEKN